jgi:cell wall-associated NlpC family hydrolase
MVLGLAPVLPATAEAASPDAGNLAAFSKASVEWGNGVEAIIEEAYRKCFRTYIVDGKVMTLHMPFGQNDERSELADGTLPVWGGGKADPLALWDGIDQILVSEDFKTYVSTLSGGREKIIVFDLEARTWSTMADQFYIDRMSGGDYPGLPAKPFVLNLGSGITPEDVYNYLYCVGRVGMDCSGFVWYALKSVAGAGGINLDRTVVRSSGAPRSAKAPLFIGTRFFDPRNGYLTEVRDEIRNLRPGDIILFRDEDGNPVHSGIIQSINRISGVIRYLQSTDEAPQEERGVHESFITFDPSNPGASLRDPSVIWKQKREAAFIGELDSPYKDDGERYRSGKWGGTIVRLRSIQGLIARLSAQSGQPTPIRSQ